MNKFMNEYLKEINNEERNFEGIKSKILKQKYKNKRIFSMVAVILVVILIGSFSPQIYAKIQLNKKYKEYIRRDYVSGKGQIATAYSETVDMDYVYQNDIGIKVNSLILTDDALKATIDIKLPEDMRIDKKYANNSEITDNILYSFGFAIYDENNVIYDVFTRINPNNLSYTQDYLTLFYKELGIKHKKYDLLSVQRARSGGITVKEQNEDNIIAVLDTKSLEGFPNSKKLYIRIFNIGAVIFKENQDAEYLDFSNSEWKFEIETPDKFIKREAINLVLLDEIPKLSIEKFTVSETGTVLKAKKKDVVEIMGAGKDMDSDEWSKVQDALINITDEEGNIYYPVQGGTTGEKNGFYGFFEIDKDILKNTTLYLNMKIGDEEYSSELQVSNK